MRKKLISNLVYYGGVMIIDVDSGITFPSSNPGQGC